MINRFTPADTGPRPAPRLGRMLLVTLVWGACFAAIRFGLTDAPLLWFAALRALLAGAALLVVGAAMGRPAPPVSAWPAIGLLGLVNVTIGFAAMFAATAGVASGVAAVLANAQPLLIVLPAWALFGERPNGRGLAGLVLGFAGLAVVAAPGGGGDGALLAVGAAVAATAGTLLARRRADVDVVMLSAWQFLLGGVGLAVWAGIAEGVPQVAWTPRFVASLGFLALIGTALAYWIWFAEVRRASLVAVSAWTMLTPAFGVGIGWLLGDQLTLPQAVGTGLVLLGLPFVVLPARKRTASRPDP